MAIHLMENTITTNSRAAQINKLHGSIMANARQCLADAFEAGRLLTEQKAELGHGEWLLWLKENVSFNVRTAQRYMNLHENRDRLKNDSVSYLMDAYDKLVKPKKKEEQPLRVYTPPKPFVYDGYEYRIKPAYFGGYLVNINGGEYRSMGDTHDHAALLAREAIDVCIGRSDNLDMIRAGGEGMVAFELTPEATAMRVKVSQARASARSRSAHKNPSQIQLALSITESLSGRVSRLSIELAALKQLLENAETSELADMQEQLAELRNHAETISALFNGPLIASGEFVSAHAAAIAAGIVKVKTPLEQLDFWWAKANEEEKRIFREEKLTLQLLPEASPTPIAPLPIRCAPKDLEK